MIDCGCKIEIKNHKENQVLKILLSINAFMFDSSGGAERGGSCDGD